MKFETFQPPLTHVEADVVFLLSNLSTGEMRIIHYWECETPTCDLWESLALAMHLFGEECGGGVVDGKIYDFRPSNPNPAS